MARMTNIVVQAPPNLVITRGRFGRASVRERGADSLVRHPPSAWSAGSAERSPDAFDEHHHAIARTRRKDRCGILAASRRGHYEASLFVRILTSNCAFPYSVPEFNTGQILELSSARVGRTS